MTTILRFEQEIFNPEVDNSRENTELSFYLDTDLTIYELLGYFVRFALAAGFQPESIRDAVSSYIDELEKKEGRETK